MTNEAFELESLWEEYVGLIYGPDTYRTTDPLRQRQLEHDKQIFVGAIALFHSRAKWISDREDLHIKTRAAAIDRFMEQVEAYLQTKAQDQMLRRS